MRKAVVDIFVDVTVVGLVNVHVMRDMALNWTKGSLLDVCCDGIVGEPWLDNVLVLFTCHGCSN